MIDEIVDSIQKNQNQFRLAYQPIVKADSGRIVGAEALLRWEDSEGATHYPDEFISDLEHFGCYVRLGDWIIHKAITDIMKCKQPGFFVNVNVTWGQLAELHFADQVKRELQSLQFPADQLHLEITERGRCDNEVVAGNLFGLADYGVRIVMDDFCTQESSLALIKKYPVSQIKIDKEFILDICENSTSQAIVETLTGLAHSLRIKICLEGVESEKIRLFIKKYGADYHQGFLYAGPISFSTLMGLLQTSNQI